MRQGRNGRRGVCHKSDPFFDHDRAANLSSNTTKGEIYKL
jgi:hypothetical protein